jgi:hypothetical protein
VINNNGVFHLFQMASIVFLSLGLQGVCIELEVQQEAVALESGGSSGYGTSSEHDAHPLLASPVSSSSSVSGMSVRAANGQASESTVSGQIGESRASGISEQKFRAEFDAGEMDGIEE